MNSVVLLAVLLAAGPGRQPVTADVVDIIIDSDVPPPNVASVVFSDGTRRTVGLNNGAGRIPMRLLNADSVTASARFTNGRTDCMRARIHTDKDNTTIAEFVLPWTPQPAWRSLNVETNLREQPVSYMRTMGPRCREPSDFIGEAEIPGVVPSSERIWFHFGDPPPSLIFYHLVIYRGAYRKHAIGTRPLSVRREEIIEEYSHRIAPPLANNTKDFIDRYRIPKDFKTITLSRSEK